MRCFGYHVRFVLSGKCISTHSTLYNHDDTEYDVKLSKVLKYQRASYDLMSVRTVDIA
jgi:hypothetical protein